MRHGFIGDALLGLSPAAGSEPDCLSAPKADSLLRAALDVETSDEDAGKNPVIEAALWDFVWHGLLWKALVARPGEKNPYSRLPHMSRVSSHSGARALVFDLCRAHLPLLLFVDANTPEPYRWMADSVLRCIDSRLPAAEASESGAATSAIAVSVASASFSSADSASASSESASASRADSASGDSASTPSLLDLYDILSDRIGDLNSTGPESLLSGAAVHFLSTVSALHHVLDCAPVVTPRTLSVWMGVLKKLQLLMDTEQYVL
jgi:hypothetical protein